jgi:capsule biosynthesis phosphatase
MYCVVLCGGLSTRLQNYSLPKPLNFIQGKPFVYYFFQTLPAYIKDIIFIYNSFLEDRYNFESLIRHYAPKHINLLFQKLPYVSRGAVESAYIGLEQLSLDESRQIMFLDNDNLHNFTDVRLDTYKSAFLGYNIDTSDRTSFSFITFSDSNQLLSIEEKKKISNYYNVGIYGFESVKQFKEIASEYLSEIHSTEFYISGLYKLLLNKEKEIQTILIDKSKHFGTYDEIIFNLKDIPTTPLRICFDLDNTLVTYPYKAGDYSSVKPIQQNIQLLRKLKKEGHTIIIYTARRMLTHNHNVGAVMKDIAQLTFKTLEELEIPYDEIIFGKPIADIYIDDRAINPYFQTLQVFGKELDSKEDDNAIINKLPNNKYNRISLYSPTRIIKEGPQDFIKNEAYYYEAISHEHDLNSYFPKFFSYKEKNNKGYLELEYVKGVPFFTLMKNKVLYAKHLELLFQFLEKLHNKKKKLSVMLNKTHVKDNYIAKLEKRFADTSIYTFENIEEVKNTIFSYLESYINSQRCTIVEYIHGDFWFSNMIYTFDNRFCCFDMKGMVDTLQTTEGDPLYDYAKMLQSILGFDLILHNINLNEDYSNTLFLLFKSLLKEKNLLFEDVFMISMSLISGTLHAIDDKVSRERVWDWLTNLLKQKDKYLNN